MDSNNINYKEEVLKAGLIMAGVSIIMTMLVYLINIELMVSWWFGLLSLTLSMGVAIYLGISYSCLLYTSPSPRDQRGSRMPSSA